MRSLSFLLILCASCNQQTPLETQSPPKQFINFGIVVTDSCNAMQLKPLITDGDVYLLLVQAILPHGQLTTMEKRKLLNLTSSDIRSYITFPLTTYCSTRDSIEWLASCDTTLRRLDCSVLPNTTCIPVSEALALFRSEQIDAGWRQFRKTYGSGGLHYLSIPLFNRERTKALMVVGGTGSSKIGSTELLFLQNEHNRWTIYHRITLEII